MFASQALRTVAEVDREESRLVQHSPRRRADPLLLIHGAWLSARSWETFVDYFGTRGFAVSAPEWPRKHGDVEELREHADELAGLGLREIVDHYDALIRALDEPPVLIGHSFGGLVVELLLDSGLGRAGVALSPAPPKGILRLPFSQLKSASPALAHPSKWHGVVTLTLDGVRLRVRQHVRARRRGRGVRALRRSRDGQIIFEAGFANFHLHAPSEVHFSNDEQAPLLIVGADQDHTVPASVARMQAGECQKSSARTEYLEFEGRPHLFIVGEGWEDVAAAIDSWLDSVLAP